MAKAAYGDKMADLSEICQEVWNQPNIQDKKNLLLRACNSFKYKTQGEGVRRAVEKSTCVKELDKIAGNIILNKTDKVVQMLKR